LSFASPISLLALSSFLAVSWAYNPHQYSKIQIHLHSINPFGRYPDKGLMFLGGFPL